MKKRLALLIVNCSLLIVHCTLVSAQRYINFDAKWEIDKKANGNVPAVQKTVTLPHAWNEDYAYKVASVDTPTDTCWYRKHFNMSLADLKNKKVFVEFEGVRQGGEFYLNGKWLGRHENGVMAVGFDLTPYIIDGDNLLEVRTDNDWNYHEVETGSKFQWHDRNFNMNMGGIPKNVWLHIVSDVYQTLPLYSNLETTGVYVYANEINIKEHTALINVESEIKNDGKETCSFYFKLRLPKDIVAGKDTTISRITLPARTKTTVRVQLPAKNIKWWSIGQGNLYDITTQLVCEKGEVFDEVVTRTGFRSTKFGNGLVWLNDKVIQAKGYAQRSSNEWPSVGIDNPAWLSDYSNALLVQSGGNLVRWMHICPAKKEIESCDRVGLMQAMPAGDSEKDVTGRRWEHRVALMRDAIIYNRNNPSIIFYEGGNESISREHMLDLKGVRDEYDPHGGRAMGCREMLDIDEAEYGGEMLYINKSKKHPMWATEYCRDESLRKWWDNWSYPFHKTGDGPLHKGKPATSYNHNNDEFARELVHRWYDYWRERPGTGTRVSSGGAKIIFSDSNTHGRGSECYRRSGVVDAMRIAKDAFYAHQVMWHGWVDQNRSQTYIVGHWNYADTITKHVYVVSNGEQVELFLNGKSLGKAPERECNFLFIFPKVKFEAGKLEAVAYDAQGKEVSRHSIKTAGQPKRLKLTALTNPEGFKADASDLALIQVEVVDKDGNRCPLDNRNIKWTVKGPAEWRGGLATGHSTADKPEDTHQYDNFILAKEFPVECGVNRAFVRSTDQPGKITVTVQAKGLPKQTITLETQAMPDASYFGLGKKNPCIYDLKKLNAFGDLPDVGTYTDPVGPTYTQTRVGVEIKEAQASSAQDNITASYDDNELSIWKGGKEVTYKLERAAKIDDICLKLSGWKRSSYPIDVYAGDRLIWRGLTDTSLGYCHIMIDNPVESDTYTLKISSADPKELQKTYRSTANKYSEITEVAGGKANEMADWGTGRYPKSLGIIEVEFLEKVK